MLLWSFIAILFFIIEFLTLSFGFVFIGVGALIIVCLLNFSIITQSSYLIQTTIMSLSTIIAFIVFYYNFRKRKTKTYFENMEGIVIEDFKNKEGKIKWSGTICNAVSNINLKQNDEIIIKEFKGNLAIISKK